MTSSISQGCTVYTIYDGSLWTMPNRADHPRMYNSMPRYPALVTHSSVVQYRKRGSLLHYYPRGQAQSARWGLEQRLKVDDGTLRYHTERILHHRPQVFQLRNDLLPHQLGSGTGLTCIASAYAKKSKWRPPPRTLRRLTTSKPRMASTSRCRACSAGGRYGGIGVRNLKPAERV